MPSYGVRRGAAVLLAGSALCLAFLIAKHSWVPSAEEGLPYDVLLQRVQRQRGAVVGAREGVREPKLGQRVSKVEVDTGLGGVRRRRHLISANEPLVSAHTVREAMASLKGRRVRNSENGEMKVAHTQQLRYTGR